MAAYRVNGVVVSLYADADPETVEAIERIAVGSPFQLSSVTQGNVGGTVRCLFTKRSEGMRVGGGNLVDLVFRLQRAFEVDSAARTDEALAVGA
jgi:hypothetical protein